MKREEIRQQFSLRVVLLESAAAALEREARETLAGLKHIDRISFRTKDTDSFIQKAFDRGKSYRSPLAEIEDQIGGRVLVFFNEDIRIVLDKLQGCFNEVESSRRQPESSWEFGYESHHLICMIPPVCLPDGWAKFTEMPQTFELQVRTLFMHAWAEPEHDIRYKGKPISRGVERQLAFAAAAAASGDDCLQRALEEQRKGGRNIFASD